MTFKNKKEIILKSKLKILLKAVKIGGTYPKISKKNFKLNLKNLLIFGFIWLMTGFAIGSSTLIGLVRWMTKLNLSPNLEDIIVQFTIILLVLTTFVISAWFTQRILQSQIFHVKAGIPFLCTVFAFGTIFLWLLPEVMEFKLENTIEEMGHFTFGPFPTEERLIQLKNEGCSAVISLVHPAVIPFESQLLAEEKNNCQKVGIPLIHLPMLPWISENESALDSIARLACSGREKCHVHYYPGKDRVSVMKRMVENITGTEDSVTVLPEIQKALEDALGPVIPDEVTFNITEVLQPAKGIKAEAKSGILSRFMDFFDRAIPDIVTIILLGPVFLLYTIIAAAFAGWLRIHRKVRAPYTRKVFHFLIFTMASILQFLGGLSLVALFGGIVSLCVLYALYRGDDFSFFEAMARPTDAPHRKLFIFIPLLTTALGGLTANFLFGQIAYIGYLVSGWGDAVGEPVGTRWGKHRYRVPSLAGVMATRSLEGSIAVFLVGTLAALVGLLLNHIPLNQALLVATTCGLTGALVESISNHGLDNFTIQVTATGTAYLLLM